MREREYNYSVTWSDEDEVFIGRVAEFRSLSAHGKSPEAALREIMKVVRHVIEELEEGNEPVPQPYSKRTYSGRLVLRMPTALHQQLSLEADRQGVSLNQFINLKLAASK
jgi:predicted HicB family RNase H-like nuclease